LIAKDYGTTGFVVMDKFGGVVACNLTMGGLFGTGRMIRGTGILAAAAPEPDRDGTIAMAPMVIINKHTGDAFLAGAASADGAAPLVLVTAVLSAIGDGVLLERALESARVRPGAGRGAVLVERNAGESVRNALARGGYRVLQTGPIGRVNVMYCPDGIERGPKLCDVQADRRGHGHAINAEF
jgi:gamma-glutamyltranspeptidase/glutathione hydrolase